MTKIGLYNRDGQKIWLEQVKGEWWQLRFDQPTLMNYTRFILEEDNESIYAVDPPGGPFISIGFEVGIGEEYVVEEIKNTSLGIFLRLGKNKKRIIPQYPC